MVVKMMDIVAVDDGLDVASLSDISLASLGRSRSPPAGGLNAEPVVVRGNGSLTVFGLNNRFSSQFPQSLLARVAPEEFRATVDRVNSLLSKALPLQMKWVIVGCFCCCCTLGCSFWPVICMNKKTRLSIEKLLDYENTHLYRRLNLRWKLAQMHLDSSSMLEYVLVIEFVPKRHIYRPD